ncbi:MAG: hypothetical protein OXI66_09175 [Boseongicola sp.]|nr:hypothetical protein [Boseongicola sp.]
MYLIDTNVVSEVAKPDPSPSALAWLDRQAEDALYLTSVTVAEINAGVHKLDAGRRRDVPGRRLKDTVARRIPSPCSRTSCSLRILAPRSCLKRSWPLCHARDVPSAFRTD